MLINSKKYTKKNKHTKKKYDIVIIGSGISGLYTLYKLSKNYPDLKILLLESNERYGGRIYSYKETIDNKDYIMDFGAGRLGHHHKLIKNLLKQLNLSKKIINIPNTKIYINIDNKNNKVTNETKLRDSIMKKLYKLFVNSKISTIAKNILQKYYLNELLEKYFGKTFSQKVASIFEYTSDLNEFNAYDAIEYFKHDYQNDSKFFTLNGGLGQIIENLLIKIRKSRGFKSGYIKINNLSSVENINYNNNNNSYELYVNNSKNTKQKSYIINSKVVICGIPKNSLKKFAVCKPIVRDLESINNINLLRIFEVYNKNDDDGKMWFENIKKTVTNTPIQFVIPINPSSGLIMSSYSDCKNANYWNNLFTNKGINYVKEKLNKYLNTLFSIYNINVPKSKYIKMHYWDAGVVCWKKNVDSDSLSEKLLNPFPRFYIIGENYSKYQAWCEGALQTSEKCIENLECTLNILKKSNNKSHKKKN